MSNIPVTREDWAKSLCAFLGAPQSQRNIIAVVAWESAEGSRAIWNPLATTQPWPGAWNFNSVGVKNYVTETDGLNATIKTLLHTPNQGYEKIVKRLRASSRPRRTLSAVEQSSWGTGALAKSIVDDVKRNYNNYAKQSIGQ